MSSPKKIKVVFAEDNELLRKSIISLIQTDPEIEVIGEAANGLNLLEILNTHTPDIILTDLEMPEMSGVHAVEKIKENFPSIKIIVLSMHTSDIFIAQMYIRGVNGYLEKGCSPTDLFSTIKKVHENDFCINEKICKRVVFSSIEYKTFQSVCNQLTLNEREQEVLMLFCKENSNREISQILNISVGTVEFHKRNIYNKTFTNTPLGLLRYAIRKGLAGF